MPSSVLDRTKQLPIQVAGIPLAELQERKEEIIQRISEIALPEDPLKNGRNKKSASNANNASNAIIHSSANGTNSNHPTSNVVTQQQHHLFPPIQEKKDTHWDFVMKEMMWLGADFASERKRQIASAKKMAAAIKQHHKTKESRRVRELAEAELKRRRLAAKLSREFIVKGWWNKIDRIVTYKQKLHADEQRKKAMNQQLISLVKQTERYSKSLVEQDDENSDDNTEDDNDASMASNDEDGDSQDRRASRRSRQIRNQSKKRLSIEEALVAERKRKSKGLISDYSRIRLDKTDNELYGESTADESGSSEASYAPESDADDETTILEAEHDELEERRRRRSRRSSSSTNNHHDTIFMPDPDEVQKLYEESEMDVNDVIQRLMQEGSEQQEEDDQHHNGFVERNDENYKRTSKRVAFETKGSSPDESPVRRSARLNTALINDDGNDADDDGDASDVEDFVDTQNKSDDDEFQADEMVVDDETTMEQEEKMPQEYTADQELDLLKQEGELSIEELRSMYPIVESIVGNPCKNGHIDSNDEEHNEEKADTNGIKDINADNREPIASGDTNTQQPNDEDEYVPMSVDQVDDETTLEAEEKLGRELSHEEEMKLLESENEIPIEQLRAMYAGIANNENDDDSASDQPPESARRDIFEDNVDSANEADGETMVGDEESRDMSGKDEMLRARYQNLAEDAVAAEDTDEADNRACTEPEKENPDTGYFSEGTADDNAEDFKPNAMDAVDDETTLEAEERLGRDMSYADEMAMLKNDSELPIEELLKMYGKIVHDEESGGEISDSEVAKSSTGRGKRKASMGSDDADSKKQKIDGHSASEQSDEGLRALNALEASAEKARQTLATRPYLLASWVKPREYQQIGLNWLVSLQSRRLNGILADEMGLGKTLQTINLFAYLASYKGIWGPHLIVVPTSVIINWETELKRFCPALKVLCYHGSAKRRKELRTGWTKTNWYHVVVTSYQLAVQDAFAFKRKRWYYLVLDEAQNIKNFQSQRWQTLINFNTQRRLLLTGTPLQNNLMELWSLLHFLMPYIFRSRKEFSYWFSNPMNNIIEGNASRNDDIISRLHGIIRPFVLRRLKKDVEKQMPGKYEHILKCQLSRRQMTLYEEFMARSSTRQALTKGGNFMGMMNVLMQLRKVCNHPDLFEPRSIVTPFVVQHIDYIVPACSVGILYDRNPLRQLSDFLLSPIWSGSCGLPCEDAYLKHTEVEAIELKRLAVNMVLDEDNAMFIDEIDEPEEVPEEFIELLKDLDGVTFRARKDKMRSQNNLNSWRCRSRCFPYPADLQRLLDFRNEPLKRRSPVECEGASIVSTPSALLRMRKTQIERAASLGDLVDKFVFCVPPIGVGRPQLHSQRPGNNLHPSPAKDLEGMLLEPLEEYFSPFRRVHAKLSTFFPDKKLIQYDAGKLQTLAELLRTLKSGGHRALIFTQMSKMLDILEAFLNLYGYTYLRLDGATGVDRRQRYMDRFNNDTKIFCFILSTRSGGMGINLTGADTVIFYDSDWNPAMDAQAQDRAHRIGQTRDVHIYRLITEHSIEENILLKAKQKRNLDIVVMDEGNFDASLKDKEKPETKAKENSNSDVYSKNSLRAILGVDKIAGDPQEAKNEPDTADMSKEQMEIAMASLEDDDDVKALHGAQKEAAEEMKEFDENAEVKADSDAEDSNQNPPIIIKAAQPETKPTQNGDSKSGEGTAAPAIEETKDEDDMAKEFAAWQSKVGVDATAIDSSLSLMERYGLNFREKIDPFYSIFSVQEQQRRVEETEADDGIDIDHIEREKAQDERLAIDYGDLLATRPTPEQLVRQRNLYLRERSRLRADKKRMKLTGEHWIKKTDGTTKKPFWYNDDTGEATWDKPLVLLELEADDLARQNGWAALPLKPLSHIMLFLIPYPERTTCIGVCRHWKRVAADIKFVRHVYPVEMGALASKGRKEFNHFATIQEALDTCLPGDTIELGDGHYWVKEPGLQIDFPLRFVGDENNPSNVVIELSGSIKWSGKGGWIEGITVRRPKLTSGVQVPFAIMSIEENGRVDMINSVFDNEGSAAAVVTLTGSGHQGDWNEVVLRNGAQGGIILNGKGSLELTKCVIKGSKADAINCASGKIKAAECRIERNDGCAIVLSSGGRAEITKCYLERNSKGILLKESGCTTSCTMNTVAHCGAKLVPGFKLAGKNGERRRSSINGQSAKKPP